VSYVTITYKGPPPPPPPTTKLENFVERQSRGTDGYLKKVLNWTNKNIFDKIPSDCWLAGGSVRSIMSNSAAYDHHNAILMEVNDFDIYFASDRDFEIAKAKMNSGIGATLIRKTPFSEKYELEGLKFDLVNVIYESPLECIRSFDFTICCAAITPDSLIHHKEYFEHISTKSLVINEINNPVAALSRIQKYAKKGFEANSETLLSIARDIASLPVDSSHFNVEELYN